jgi:perosamine synthetase
MKRAAIEALENEFFIMGESVKKFEDGFARYVGAKYAITVGSGTAALQFALMALGIRQGDSVITAPNSFIASSNSVIHAGGIPAFCDIEPDTGNMNPKQLKASDKRAKGLIPVHLYGQSCDMDPIMDYARERDMFVLEDACQAHGTTYKGKKSGTIGDAGCFSFYSSKNLFVAGDGGMVVTDNEQIAAKVRKLRDCGRISKYEHDTIGYTSRLNTVNCAMGLVQLRHLDEGNLKRKKLAKLYKELLPSGTALTEKQYGVPVYHLFVIKARNRDKVANYLKENDIQTGIHYPIPIHLQHIYRQLYGYRKGDFPVCESFAKDILSLPIYPELKEDEVQFICSKLKEAMG